MEDLTGTENGLLGVTSALLEGVLLQPTLYWKNMRQQRLPLSIDPRLIYRGMGAALCNEAGQMGMQFVVTGLFKSFFSDSSSASSTSAVSNIERSLAADLGAAAGGGAVVALFATPVELIMIQQQRFGGSLLGTPLNILRAHGAFGQGLMRGLGLTMARDSIYVGGMLGMAPIEQQYLMKNHDMAILPATLWGSALGGVVGGVVSHPFDVIKTCMQGDMTQETYRGTLATARTLLKSGGVSRFFNGCFWRTFNIAATVYIANECCQRLPPYLKLFTRSTSDVEL